MLKVFFLGVVSIAIGWMPQAQARFDTEMDKLNQAYRNKIYTSEQYKAANVDYNELNKLNQERFAYASGIRGKIRKTGPTEKEWGVITEALWQHAACLLENYKMYDDEKGFHKRDIFQQEIHSLLDFVTGTTLSEQGFKNINSAAKNNILALTSGLFYALRLYTSHFYTADKRFDGWAWAGLDAYKEQAVFSSAFKDQMDSYFERTYKTLRKEYEAYSDNVTASHGHLVFLLTVDQEVKANFIGIVRQYVTKLAGRPTDGRDYQVQSRFYGARVTTEENLREMFPAQKNFDRENPQDFQFPIKPLVISKDNIDKYPTDQAVWLKASHLFANKLCTYQFEKQKEGRVYSTFRFALNKKEKLLDLRRGETVWEYVELILDYFMIYPTCQAGNWTTNPLSDWKMGK